MYYKYPRTPHLPWSPGATSDDVWSVAEFEGQSIVVTEKMDGENTTMYRDHIHARSIDSRHHESRSWVKAMHQRIAHMIPEGWRICGENCFAKHSIGYNDLPSYFMVFSIWDEHNTCLSWDDMLEWSQLLELDVVSTLYEGPWDEAGIRNLSSALDLEKQEGYVVRTRGGFAYEAFSLHLAKWVRANHVTSDKHWMHQQVVPNGLSGESHG